jgi:hypothetical protein
MEKGNRKVEKRDIAASNRPERWLNGVFAYSLGRSSDDPRDFGLMEIFLHDWKPRIPRLDSGSIP